MKTLHFTVTNDLSHDQRMHRICGSLAAAGYAVTLIGRELKTSTPLAAKPFEQKRLKCFFNKGLLFYAEYNLRLFFFLMGQKTDALCAIDLDTILPVLFVSKLKNVRRVYDAHEYFTEMKEVRIRPLIKTVWQAVANFSIPRFKHAYTVSDGLAAALEAKYKVKFITISNFPVLTYFKFEPADDEPYLFFGGAVNEARAFEYLVPAMRQINTKLIVAGDGNFMPQLKALINEHNVQHKVELKGMVTPEELREYASKATLGLGLAEREGINQYWALSNKFTDYMHAALPQLTMDYPEYRQINDKYKVAVLIDNLKPEYIATTINTIISNRELLADMREACVKAREEFNWQREEKKLLLFYKNIFQ